MKRKEILYTVSLGCLLGCCPIVCHAMPTGGNVVAGDAAISEKGTRMVVAGSGNAGILWTSFDIQKEEAVSFNGMDTVLNYVTGSTSSTINGTIDGTAHHVYLINPNGIIVGKDGHINVNHLVLSTRKMSVEYIQHGMNNPHGLFDVTGYDVKADIIDRGLIEADELLMEGNKVILTSTKNVKTKSGEDITGRNKENYVLRGDAMVAYEVEKNYAIDVGDGKGNTLISNYATGNKVAGEYKGSEVFTGENLDGTSSSVSDAMAINNVKELQGINQNMSGTYMLVQDIDATGTKDWNGQDTEIKGFHPIGYKNTPYIFSGKLEGANFTISDLFIKNSGKQYEPTGVFRTLAEGSSISDLYLKKVDITGGNNVGSIAGSGGGFISNIHVDGDVRGIAAVGGLVGSVVYDKKIEMDHSWSNVTVIGTRNQVGGLVGELENGTITDSYSIGNIKGANYVGGLAGFVNAKLGTKILITNVYATGNVEATGNDAMVGGLLGRFADSNSSSLENPQGTRAVLSDAYATGNVTGLTTSRLGGLGGLIGELPNGTVVNTYASGHITGGGFKGALIGIFGDYSTSGNERKSVILNTYGLDPNHRNGLLGIDQSAKIQKNTIANSFYRKSVNGVSTYREYGKIGEFTEEQWKDRMKANIGDQASHWKFYNGRNPLLTAFLTPLTVEDIKASALTDGQYQKVYTGRNQNVAGDLIFSDVVDSEKIKGNILDAGTYNLEDVFYSDQQGYDIQGLEGKTLTVTKAKLTLKAKEGETTYGTDWEVVKSSLTYELSGLVGKDEGKVLSNLEGIDFSITPSYSSNGFFENGEKAGHTKDAGEYTWTLTGTEGTLKNYDVVGESTAKLVIKKKDIDVVVLDKSITYGDTTLGNIDFTASGMVYGDTESTATMNRPISYTSEGWIGNTEGNGRYTGDANLSGYSSDTTFDFKNYNVKNLTNGKLFVQKKNVELTTKIGEKQSFAYTYGDAKGMKMSEGTATLPYRVEGLVNGDQAKDVGTFQNTALTANGRTKPVSSTSYQLAYEVNSNNYEVKGNHFATITVNPKKIIVKPSADTIEYGTADTWGKRYTAEGFAYEDSWNKVNGTPVLTTDGIFMKGDKILTQNVGNYNISISTTGLSATNYIFEGESLTEGLHIIPYTGKVTVRSEGERAREIYGNQEGTYHLLYEGLVNGNTSLWETESSDFLNTGFENHLTKDAGTYELIYRGTRTHSNYSNIEVKKSVVSVNKRKITFNPHVTIGKESTAFPSPLSGIVERDEALAKPKGVIGQVGSEEGTYPLVLLWDTKPLEKNYDVSDLTSPMTVEIEVHGNEKVLHGIALPKDSASPKTVEREIQKIESRKERFSKEAWNREMALSIEQRPVIDKYEVIFYPETEEEREDRRKEEAEDKLRNIRRHYIFVRRES